MIFDLMNEKIVKAILETIPIEITVIDEMTKLLAGISMKQEYLKD